MFYYLFLILTSLFIYLPSIGFFFIGDDFANLTAKLQEIIFVRPSHNHYFPVSWLILFFSHKLFQTNSFFYHGLIISIFTINVLLIYKATSYFFSRKKWQFLTAILFTFFFANYEVVFWISVIFINSSLTFYLLGFIFFAGYLQTKKSKDFILFVLFSLLSILAMEFGISLVAFCFFYLVYKKQKINLKKFFNYFFIPILVFAFISLVKIKTLTIASSSSPITPTKWLVSLITFLTHSFYPNPFFWEIFFQLRKESVKFFLVAIAVVAICGLIFTKIRKFKGIGFPMIIIILNSLMISFTSWAQMRYFYFLAFPSALFWVYLLKKIKNQWLVILVSIFLIVPQYFFIYQRYQDWSKASIISKKIVKNLTYEKGCEQIKKNKYPAWIGDDRYKAYIIVHPEKVMELFFNKECR